MQNGRRSGDLFFGENLLVSWLEGGGQLRAYIDPDRYTTAVGGDVTFRCVVNGNGRNGADIRWMRADGRALPERVTTRAHLMMMRRVESTDQGRYICVVSTASGQRSQAEAQLTVSGSSSLVLVF